MLHADLASYVAACGRGSEHTVGSSLVKVSDGRIESRRIDLVIGATDFLSAALPHELTHVVLKDRFPNGGLPRWADEGMAMLADPAAKQQRHEHDLDNAILNHSAFDTASLLSLADYPGSARMGVFYGQSAALVKYLVDQKSPQQFVAFVSRAAAIGYDKALRECYAVNNAHELDRLWTQASYEPNVPADTKPTKLAAR